MHFQCIWASSGFFFEEHFVDDSVSPFSEWVEGPAPDASFMYHGPSTSDLAPFEECVVM